MPQVHPRIEHLLARIQSVTGHSIDFQPAAAASPDRHAWEVVSDAGVRYGVLRVRADGTLSPEQRTLYTELSQMIAHEADLRRERQALEQRFRMLDRHNAELTAMNRSLTESTYRDPLTGLYRRWYLTEQLRLELARAKRYRRPLSLLVLDIDDFASHNEHLGPAGADTILAAVAQRISSGLRVCDVVARGAGDDFYALLIDTDADGASLVASRLRERVAATPLRRAVTICAGTATSSPPSDESAETLCERATQALNRARRESRKA